MRINIIFFSLNLTSQYIRIKLKPDDLYDDKGLSTNERVIEESEVSKPDSLSLKKSATKKAAPHFTQLVQSESSSKQSSEHHHLTPTASPKPSRSALKNAGSRSPSPATAAAAGPSISRKSSFCSLFKTKEAASPESPSGQRKKSAISILLDSPRDRSRSKSRESEKSGCSGGISANTTPSKQRSVLAIFKPRKNSSKSSSPIDPEMHEIMSKQTEHKSRKQTANQEIESANEQFQQRPGSTTPRLKYYTEIRNPAEGIHIPLHTPPDEKEDVTFATTIAVSQAAQNIPSTHSASSNVDTISTTTPIASATTSTVASPALPSSTSTTKTKTPLSERRTKQPITKCVVSTSTTSTASAQPKTKKSYRIELPDGSIRIPLRSPSDEHGDGEPMDATDNNDSQHWSTAVQRNSSQDSQDTVVSSKATSLVSTEVEQSPKSLVLTTVATIQTPPIITSTAESKKTDLPAKQVSQEETTVVTIENTNGGIRAMSKERKRILFSTKIGSGSEEQIFATQLSLSKTESLSSQLSEQGPNLESPSAEKSEIVPREEQKSLPQPINQSEVVVRMRPKEEKEIEVHTVKEDVINVNRHSMYIENIEEILETQRRLETERKNSLLSHTVERTSSADSNGVGVKQSVKPAKPERHTKTQSTKSQESAEECRTAVDTSVGAGSSGSEHESEIDMRV